MLLSCHYYHNINAIVTKNIIFLRNLRIFSVRAKHIWRSYQLARNNSLKQEFNYNSLYRLLYDTLTTDMLIYVKIKLFIVYCTVRTDDIKRYQDLNRKFIIAVSICDRVKAALSDRNYDKKVQCTYFVTLSAPNNIKYMIKQSAPTTYYDL